VPLDQVGPLVAECLTRAIIRQGKYPDAKEMDKAVEWTTRAAKVDDPESLLHLADWHEKGTNVALDAEKADQYRLQAYSVRAGTAYNDRRYEDALLDIKKASESKRTGAIEFNRLGICYGKLARWDEAIKAYALSIELDLKSDSATGVVFDLLLAQDDQDRAGPESRY
jgi:tetratricopeptide (TPR) repeat protein